MLKKEFITAFMPLCTIFDREPKPALIEAWFSLVGEYDYRDFSKAIEDFMRDDESGFFPVPAKIIRRLEKISNALLPPEEAFMVAKEIMNHNDVDRAPYARIDCPVMLKACQAVGWRAFDRSDNIDFARRSFISQYEAASKPGAVARMKAIEAGGDFSKALNDLTSNVFGSIEE